MTIPSRYDMIDAQKRIKSYIHKTPVFTSHLINEMVGGKLFFKAENLQRMAPLKNVALPMLFFLCQKGN